MQQALVVLARNGIFSPGEVERDGAIFEHDRARSLVQKFLERVR